MAINKIYYGNQTLIDLTEDNIARTDVLNGKYFHLRDGTQTTGQMANNGAISGNISTKSGTINIPAGYTSGGTIGISSTEQSKIIAGNIKTGITLLGQQGSFTSDANATATDILLDKTAYVNGSKITGTMLDYTSFPLYCQDIRTQIITYTPSSGNDGQQLYIPAYNLGRPVKLLIVSLYIADEITALYTSSNGTRYFIVGIYTRDPLLVNSSGAARNHYYAAARAQLSSSKARTLYQISPTANYFTLENESGLASGNAYINLTESYFRKNASYEMLIGG